MVPVDDGPNAIEDGRAGDHTSRTLFVIKKKNFGRFAIRDTLILGDNFRAYCRRVNGSSDFYWAFLENSENGLPK